ncbi:MAG: hypothetical protein KKI09_09900, partial [Spirochaetes bacterium]|nr:hypothetical protein [Spirochaetota bacterium]MBU0955728.1 hypothetical protein [Spirochaetota bacterium]
MKSKTSVLVVMAAAITFLLSSCAEALDWPEAPFYTFAEGDTTTDYPIDRQAAMEAIAGHYAHYDIVSYEDSSTKTPMRTLVISYGFTDFYIQDGKLYLRDRFCSAVQKINQNNVFPTFGDAAVQAIIPEDTEVELYFENGRWHVYRPETRTLLGIRGNPDLPLSQDSQDPAIIDADGDGKPGVTVELNIGNVIKGEIYIMRREISSVRMVLNPDGSLTGEVIDTSEQFVIDASLAILRQPSNAVQFGGAGMNPIILIPIDESIDTCDE